MQHEQICKTVGRPLEELSVFDRIRELNAFLKTAGLHPQQENDGEHVRRVVGVKKSFC